MNTKRIGVFLLALIVTVGFLGVAQATVPGDVTKISVKNMEYRHRPLGAEPFFLKEVKKFTLVEDLNGNKTETPGIMLKPGEKMIARFGILGPEALFVIYPDERGLSGLFKEITSSTATTDNNSRIIGAEIRGKLLNPVNNNAMITRNNISYDSEGRMRRARSALLYGVVVPAFLSEINDIQYDLKGRVKGFIVERTNNSSNNSKKYEVRDITYNADGEVISCIAQLLEDSSSPPPIPANLAATALSATEISLTWSDTANETSYEIQRKIANGSYANCTNPGKDVTSFVDTGLAASTTYYYKIKAINAVGSSDFSAEVSATTQAQIQVPAVPTSFTATAISGYEIDLSWVVTPNATQYEIRRKTGASGSYNLIIPFSSGTYSTYLDGNVQPNTTYYYKIKAGNAVGWSNFSAEVSATTPNSGSPQLPVPMLRLLLFGNGVVTLELQGVPNIPSYQVRAYEIVGRTPPNPNPDWGSSAPPVPPGSPYMVQAFIDPNFHGERRYKIRAIWNNGPGDFSPEISVWIP